MKQVLIIPNRENLEQCVAFAKKHGLGFEYNDFFAPSLLDDAKRLEEVIQLYRQSGVPEYCTVHGAFFDVIPCSVDEKVKEISIQRIEASIEVAKRIGAKAVVFHTNYNPFLNSKEYVDKWIEDNISFWSSVLEKHRDMQIYLENMFDTTPDILEALSKTLCKYPNYGVCFDYAHASISKTAPDIWAKQLGRFVKHVHINDNDLVSDLHLAWGNGKINRKDFYALYEAYMPNASILIETSCIEDSKESLEQMKQEGFLTE